MHQFNILKISKYRTRSMHMEVIEAATRALLEDFLSQRTLASRVFLFAQRAKNRG